MTPCFDVQMLATEMIHLLFCGRGLLSLAALVRDSAYFPKRFEYKCMWSKGVALASKTSVKASAHLCRKLQRCPIPCCFSLATKVMHIINPYTCNTLRRFVHVYMDFRSSTGRLYLELSISFVRHHLSVLQ